MKTLTTNSQPDNEGAKGTSNALVDVHFDIELCIQALASMTIMNELSFSFVENERSRHFICVTQPIFGKDFDC